MASSSSPRSAATSAAKPSPKPQRDPRPGRGAQRGAAGRVLDFQPLPHQRRSAYSGHAVRRSQRPEVPSGRPRRKGRFVQSAFRVFVDDVTADVIESVFEADSVIDWRHVRMVDIFCDQHPKCPICLEESMVVPKITHCGHVFCAPCIMRYFVILQDRTDRLMQRCPVCNEDRVLPEDLTSVRFQLTRRLQDGDRFTMLRVQRDASATIVRPCYEATVAVNAAAGGDLHLLEEDDDEDDAAVQLPCERLAGWHLSRVVRLSPIESEFLLQEELESLRRYRPAAIRDGDTELLPSIDAAGMLLKNKLRQLQETHGQAGEPLAPPSMGGETRGWCCRYVDVPDIDALPRAGKGAGKRQGPDWPATLPEAQAAPGEEEGPEDAGKASASQSPSVGPAGRAGGARSISFYQASDGRLIFLQPFCSRLLLHEYGRWDKLPSLLQGLRVEGLQEQTLTEELRRRHRFLSHLPTGTAVGFVDVELRTLLSRSTREHFADEFAKRREWRKKAMARDRRHHERSGRNLAWEEEQYYNHMQLAQPVYREAPPTSVDFAVDLHGNVSEMALTGEAEAEPEAEAVEGFSLAKKLREQMDAKQQKQKQKQQTAASFPELAATGPSVASRGGAASSAASSAWGPGKGSNRAQQRAESVAVTEAAVRDAWDESPAAGVPDSWDDEGVGEALEKAMAAKQDTKATEKVDTAGIAGKKKKSSKKGTTVRLFG